MLGWIQRWGCLALGVSLECGVGANGRCNRAKILDGETLIGDMSATQCQVENDAWGYRSEMRRGQRWTQQENAVGWEGNWMMPYAKAGAGHELEKEGEVGKRRACS